MKKACEPYQEGIADLASGMANPMAQAHVDGCADCARVLAQFSEAVKQIAVPEFDAPPELVRQVISLMPKRQPLIARLTASTLQAAGVRAVQSSEAFQLRFEAEGAHVRVMYSRDVGGWDIIGRLSEPGWDVFGPEGPIELQSDNSFQFRVTRLEDSEFELIGNEAMIHIPSPMDDLHGADGDR